MYTIKPMGVAIEMHCVNMDLADAIEAVKDMAGKYGWADLMKDGVPIYAAVKERKSVHIRLIQLNATFRNDKEE